MMNGTISKDRVTGPHRHNGHANGQREPIATAAPTAPARPSGGRRMLAAVAVAVVVGMAGGWELCRATLGASDAAKVNGGKATLGLSNAEDGTGGKSTSVVPMKTVAVEMVPRHALLHLTGSLVADEQSGVASNTNGIVSEVRVDRGSVVRKGDVMVQLDPTDAKNHLAEGIALAEELKAKLTWEKGSDAFVVDDQPEVKLAVAALALAASRKHRAEVLLPKNAIAVDECEQIRSEYDCAVQRCRQSREQASQEKGSISHRFGGIPRSCGNHRAHLRLGT
jgi:multidrug efflux pump subunit AcrA (membrane-fusion protein)